MNVLSLSQLSQDEAAHFPRDEAIIRALQQAAAAVTSIRGLEDALCSILDACSSGLGFLYPSVAVLRAQGDRLVGRLIASAETWESTWRAQKDLALPLDGFLGRRQERRAASRYHAEMGSIPPDALSYRLATSENLVAHVFLERTPQFTTDYYDLLRPHLEAKVAALAQQALGIDSIALLPLLAAERCLGVFIVAGGPARPITDSDLPALEIFAAQAVLAIQSVRLHQDLREREQQVSLLLKATIDAQEMERERICLEIHDGVAQTLAAAFHYLQTLDGRPELGDDVRVSLRKAASLVRSASLEAREVIATLRPAALDTVGLIGVLRYEMDELRTRTGLVVDLDVDQVRFPKEVETALYRILREAISNVTKHAQAGRVAVRVKQGPGRVVAEVQDDGVGFDPHASRRQERRKGVGLLSMHKRAELINGSFEVFSSPGNGTRVYVELPLDAREDLLPGSYEPGILP